MDVPNGTGKGKGKGKGKARRDGEEPVARPGEVTPKRSPRPSPSGSGSPASTPSRAAAFCKSVTGPVKLPHPKQVAILAACVSALAVCRSLLIPVSAPSRPAVLSSEQEGVLIPLVLARELGVIMERVETDNRNMEGLLASQASALEEVKGFEASLKASTLEIEELDELSKTVHEGHEANAGLTTEVARAQDNLRDMHRAMSTTLDEAQRQLQDQMGSMTTIRSDVEAMTRRTKGVREAVGETTDGDAQGIMIEILQDLEKAHEEVKDQLDSTRRSFLSASELEALLTETAHTSQARDHERDPKVPETPEQARRIARAAVERAVQDRRPSEAQASPGEECVTTGDLMREVDAAIGKLMADGTGLRDFANAAVGGRVVRSRGMTSNTYTPSSWLAPSWYWHRLGVENGIGPVESVISDDSSLGACWAMEGTHGHVTLELASDIRVEAVSIEHVSRLVILESDSAPARFEVFGLRSEMDDDPVLLGGGVYEVRGRPIQTFPLKLPYPASGQSQELLDSLSNFPVLVYFFSHNGCRPHSCTSTFHSFQSIMSQGWRLKYVQFRIVNNWGNPDYTCIYRLRVHGDAA